MQTFRHDAVHTADDPALDIPPNRVKPKTKKNRFNRLLFYLFPLSRLHHHDGAPPSHTTRTLAFTINSRPSTASTSISRDRDMPHSANELPLDIFIHNDPVVIRGTGIDYEPATVRGVVKLSLPEATDIKEVMVRCTGKAKLAIMQKEGYVSIFLVVHRPVRWLTSCKHSLTAANQYSLSQRGRFTARRQITPPHPQSWTP
jgi:hypothetical protein